VNENATDIIEDLRLLEPWKAPPPWAWILFFSVLLALALLVRRRERKQATNAEEGVHAHEDALAELEKARALMTPENSREYGIEVSGIVRRYIERRFQIVAPRRSTEEFLAEANGSEKLNETQHSLLAEFLGSCDFLKFGRVRAQLHEMEAMHAAAARFVKETRA
jgi:hypothetical protein